MGIGTECDSSLILAPVVGNFTDESALMGVGDGAGGEGANIGSGMPSDNTSLEYPLQRDEVQTTQQKNNHVPKSESDKHGLLPLLPYPVMVSLSIASPSL